MRQYPHPIQGRAVPRLTAAQARNREAARIMAEDAIAGLPMSDLPAVLARALLKAHAPDLVEAIANEIGRHAHMAGRA
jgi:hypothetical protein